jgi:aminopeptidase
MHDPRFDKLAKLLVEYSVRLKRNETVLIEAFDIPDEMTAALIRAARNAGGVPFAQVYHARVNRALALEATDRQLDIIASHDLARMKKMSAYIAMRGSHNITELADVPSDKLQLIGKKMRPVQDQRVKRTKWVVLRWPTPSMAQLAGMSTEAFEDFFFDVCTLDYRKLQPGMKALKGLMERTGPRPNQGPGTDLSFSIKGIPAVICGGDRNIPDGEVFTAPVKDSVEGQLTFNAPSIYQGTAFDGIQLNFKRGKIVDASRTRQKNSTRFSIQIRARVTSASFRSDLIRECSSRCAISCSTKRLPAHSISLRDKPTRKPTTETEARFTGTWSAFSVPNTAAAKYISTGKLIGRMANFFRSNCAL